MNLVTLMFTVLLLACGSEDGNGVAEGEVSAASPATSAPQRAEPEGTLPFCIHTFQVSLLDNSGKAQVRVCLDASDQTVEYLMRNRGFLDSIRESCMEIIRNKSMEELDMPSAQSAIGDEMLAGIRELLDPLTVDGLELQRFERW